MVETLSVAEKKIPDIANPEKIGQSTSFSKILEHGTDDQVKSKILELGRLVGKTDEQIEKDYQEVIARRAEKRTATVASSEAQANPEAKKPENPSLDSLPTRDNDKKELTKLNIDDLTTKDRAWYKTLFIDGPRDSLSRIRDGVEFIRAGATRNLIDKDPEKRKASRVVIGVGAVAILSAAGVGVYLALRGGQAVGLGEADLPMDIDGESSGGGDGEALDLGLEYTADNIDVNYAEYLSQDKYTQYSIGLPMDMSSVETAQDGLMETAANMPEHAAQMAAAYLSDEQLKELGLDGLTPNQLADRLHDELRAELLNTINDSDAKVEIVDGVSGSFYNWGAKPAEYDENGGLIDTELVQFQTNLNGASLLKITDADGNISYFAEHCKNFLTERPTVDIPIIDEPPSMEKNIADSSQNTVREFIQNNGDTFRVVPNTETESFVQPDGTTQTVNPETPSEVNTAPNNPEKQTTEVQPNIEVLKEAEQIAQQGKAEQVQPNENQTVKPGSVEE
jgi:hypothetical protein